MNRLEKIREEIKNLHIKSPDDCMRTWFYEGHVAVVAKYADEVAKHIKANREIAVLAALFHDIARTWSVTKEPALMKESLEKAEVMMRAQMYSTIEIDQVKKAILNHSCRDTMPATEEGRVMATADALAHFMTDFYFVLPFYQWFTAGSTFKEYKKWLSEKIERDFHKKIFYDKYRKLVKKRYDSFKLLFSQI